MNNSKKSNKPWLHQYLENIWYNNSAGKYALLPLTLLYCFISTLRRWKQECQRPQTEDIPIIVVGNISVGGTGKTPLVVHIVKQLQQAGYSPAIISRGYKGKAKEWPQHVTATTPPHLVGDEPVLLATQTHVPIVVGPNRNINIRCLLNHHSCNIIVSDDGLQHYKMPRAIEVIVIDAIRGFGNGWCLPAGPLREPPKRLGEGDFCVINADNNQHNFAIQHPNRYAMHLQGDVLINLSNAKQIPLTSLAEQTVHAVTGIGHPQRFFCHLENAGLKLLTHSFADHHNFQKEDMNFQQNYPIIMTEKDAVKCRKFQSENCWYLPVKAQLSTGFTAALLARLNTWYIDKNVQIPRGLESAGHSTNKRV